jgi:hypothetical protein
MVKENYLKPVAFVLVRDMRMAWPGAWLWRHGTNLRCVLEVKVTGLYRKELCVLPRARLKLALFSGSITVS